MSVATKTWLNDAGATMTHGELMRAMFDGNPENAQDGNCVGVLEQRGDREVNSSGDTYVAWYGSRHHVMLFCPVCQPDPDDSHYVTTVKRPSKASDPFGDDAAPTTPATDLW